LALMLTSCAWTGGPPRCPAGPTPRSSPGALARLTVRGSGMSFGLDRIGTQAYAANRQLRLERGDPLVVEGWAIDRPAGAPAPAVLVRYDDEAQPILSVACASRPDIAAAFHDPHFERSGFETTIATRDLHTGWHILTFYALTADGRSYVATGKVAVLIVEPLPTARSAVLTIDGVPLPQASAPAVVRVDPEDDLALTGWALVDLQGHQDIARGVRVAIDGRPRWHASYGSDTITAGDRLLPAPVPGSGFSARLPIDDLAPGRHDLSLVVETTSQALRSSAKVVLEVLRDPVHRRPADWRPSPAVPRP
jgi:hypothetical protein